MLKQIFNKLPRRSVKSDSQCDSNTDDFGDNNCSDNGSCQSIRCSASKRTSSAVFPSSVVAGIEPLQGFKDVPSAERMNLFISKLNLCATVFDFNDIGKNSVEKDMKRQILIELVNFISSVSSKFSEPAITSLCRMCAMNIFRVFPPNYRSNSSSGENEEDDPVFDPAWPHLQIVYEILLKFITSPSMEAKIAKKSVNNVFILRILDLFHSEDPRERECLKTLLHRIYGKFMVHRPFIRKIIGNIFYRYVFEFERHNGISELLEIFGSIISGFALPLKEEHKLFLWRALIPLHKPKSLGFYFQQLSYCISQFIEKDPKLAGMVIKGLLKYWPITNSQKEVMFLGELEEILEGINMMEFQKIMVPLFWRIGCCIQSFHFQVSERALFFWNNDRIVNLIAHNRHVILPIVFPALERNSGTHWNHAVLNLTLNVRKMFLEMDEPLLFACDARFHEEEAALRSGVERRKQVWQDLEDQANLIQPGVTGNTAVLVSFSDLRTRGSLSPLKGYERDKR